MIFDGAPVFFPHKQHVDIVLNFYKIYNLVKNELINRHVQQKMIFYRTDGFQIS